MAKHSLAGEFVAYIIREKKWWLMPLLVVLLLMGALMLVGSSPAAPFIYPLF